MAERARPALVRHQNRLKFDAFRRWKARICDLGTKKMRGGQDSEFRSQEPEDGGRPSAKVRKVDSVRGRETVAQRRGVRSQETGDGADGGHDGAWPSDAIRGDRRAAGAWFRF